MTAHWIIKSEPETWSWEDQLTHKTTHWDGVRNYQAANNLKAMRLDDLCFFYHSGSERRLMGIVRVTKEAHLDPTDETGRFVMVDVDYVESLKNPVPLSLIKSLPNLAHLALVKQSRLSVMPVDSIAWKTLLTLGGHLD